MEQGRGSSITWEKEVTQNGNIWIPLTPDKQVLQSSNNTWSDMQQNQIGEENWHDLIDVYEDYLRNKQPHSFNLNKSEGVICTEHNHEGVPPAKNHSRLQQNLSPNCQDVAPVEVYNSLPLNCNPNSCTGVNNLEQNVSILQRLRSLNQNSGEVVPPQEVNSFADLMNIMSAKRSHSSNGSPDGSTFLEGYPTISSPVSQVESNQVAYASAGLRVHQNHILHGSNAGFQQREIFYGNHDGAGYNQQEILNSRPSVAKDTLNLTPRSEARVSSSASRSSTLGPVTPDQQKQSTIQRIGQVPHLLIHGTSTPEKHIHGSVALSSESEVLEKEHGDILANSMATSTAAISTSPQEMRCSDGGNGGIDLNKTPQQKTPKRTKHRPKVVVEGKPKRTPKPAYTKSNTPDGNLPAKRKCVRRNDTKNSTPPISDTVEVVEASDMGPAPKSCKRKLNFDIETGTKNRAEKEGQGQCKQLDHQEQNKEWHKLALDSSGPSMSAAKAGDHNTYDKDRQQTQTAYNFVHSINKILPQVSMPLETTTLPPTSRDHNLNDTARSFNMRNSSICQSNSENRYNQVHHHSNGGLTRPVFQANPYEHNLGFRPRSSVQTTPQVLEHLMNVTDKQGTKRTYEHTVIGSLQNIAMMGSHFQSRGVPEWQTGSETCKTNYEDRFHGSSFSMQSGYTTVEEFIRQIESRMNKSFLAQSSTEPHNGELRNSECRRQMINIYPTDNSTNVICDQYTNNPDISHKFQRQHASSQVHLCSERMLPKTSHSSANMQITKSVAAVINRNLESASNRYPQSIPINRNIHSPLHAVVKKRTAGLTTYKKASPVDKVLQQEPENKRSYGNSSKEVAGTRVDKRNLVSVDYITDGMKDLCITTRGKEFVWKEQSALIPYKGYGAVVPYEEFDLVKKRKPRPRVNLDPETNRLWNLLMGKEGGESAETMDTNREKWWEDERKIFRGRVDSFIARMHLVQGDRRFSKWKGSVVDSVIGVFLTQNVSDHLSSSAFMSLAAKFPSKSTTAGEQCCQKGGSPSAGNHEVCITYPDGTTFQQKMVKEPVYGHSSVTSIETFEHMADNVMPEKETCLINGHTRRTEEDIISSQSSSESLVLQASEDVRSSSGSNSEAECAWNISKNGGHLSVPQQAERIAALQQNKFQLKESSYINRTHPQQFEKPAYRQSPGWVDISKVQHHQSSVLPFTNSWPNMSMEMQNWEKDGFAFLGRERVSTLTSEDSRCMYDYRGQTAESAFIVSEDGRSKSQTSSIKHPVLEKGLELKNDSLNEAYNSNCQHFIKNMREKQVAFDREGTTEAFRKQPSDNRKHTEVETDMGREQSSDKLSNKISVTTANVRKGKAEKEKAEPINWDLLRKQVQSKAGTTGRNREAMDSLDYEAMINADVHEISETIKERGMNNMLAERMKNFLHRLVEDHERIDLEWLRDVQPDKAKDYLLSIRGLGLKSVECIRLLTLHHLAFPVDTNVGRIAVRLGWVPLQPLPESLQLHLLELYPILESIQKYLWPRLCKLDQETLYELHYQMITFGKVFCTKRDPNCNACPMRGECRHFASAFASARLALPGPQERHIVSSAAPRANNRSDVIIKPMPLPPLEDTMEQGARLSRDCEPFIEEPTTPEPPAEVEERDIEDAFYEDPDEIPVIKLNIEEFTTNLQSFIQGQIEIGEGDMSRALVALNPELPSIPTPKLKHISRLRTEHQVYELPDSHSLLEGMDRRDPDDSTPYLLAIWTPGETADSIQPPESKCSYMEGGGLCNNETCFSCSSTREAHAQTVRGTILIPCRTAMRGSFPLNGTYFQVNEVFADHESSLNPIDVPRSLLWNLPRRTVFFGSSVSSIFKGLSTEDIQFCFWKGFVCVRGFELKTRAPRPLKARLHFPASKIAKRNEETESKAAGKAES
ncbi:HhH-GPD base excision DNA repair family protein [Perilla frutescens var. frutescens]|nr:HhH-GPD base excision DNA repair family protein [Perilla frutescens var. frutescens]